MSAFCLILSLMRCICFARLNYLIKFSPVCQPQSQNFFTNLVVASLPHERQMATEAEIGIQQLTVQQVVAWFVKDGKIPTEQGTEAAFLDL